ncbi:MAG: hypothetical protein ALECFALPRED_002725 [Alectoria fallacina]|uniref:Uncharacterized protein n=1 Tax=Alectoria fallacina TaxID=1903189 RepID=A0A8H3FFK9_9LECA|nr:MAG: hypothetical protein ALECFALPRED_002725 [Alectoria fallacina]
MSLSSGEATSTSTQVPEAQITTGKAEHPVDARFRKLRARILPESPYILHVRSTYRQSPEHANLWRIGTHFDPNEEELQYLTFKDRTNDLTPGLFCRGGWDDGKGGLALPEEPYSRTSSDGTPLQGQGQKKKISLADYNKRDKNRVVAVTTKHTSPKPKEQQQVNTSTKEIDANARVPKPLQVEQRGQKRPANVMTVGKDPNASEQLPAAPSAKKARITPELPHAASAGPLKAIPQRSNGEIAVIKDLSDVQKIKSQDRPKTERPPTEKQLGPRKVATKEKRKEAVKLHGLPPMLSPTLPSEIEEELAKLNPSIRRHSGSIAKSKSPKPFSKIKQQKRDPTGSSTDEEGARSSIGAKVFASTKISTTTSSVKHQQSQPQVTSAPRQAAKNVVSNKVTPTKPNGLFNSPVTAPVTVSTTPQRMEKRRLRLLLKIKKKTNRKNIAQYLSLRPTPGKYPHIRHMIEHEQRSRTPQSEQKRANNYHDNRFENQAKSKHNDAEAPKAGEKRRGSPDRRDEPELPVKRHKTPGWLPQNAHTPKQPSTSSPAPSNIGIAQKPQLLTPKADPKSAPMLRVESGEGSTTTPRGLALNGTPDVPDAGNRRNSVTSSGGRKPSLHQVKRDANKYLRQATDLKHASDVFFKDISKMADSERKRGVMIGTESVLCYILAFTLFDEPQRRFGQYGNIDGWKSVLRLLDLINREAQPFRHLTGLLLQVEGIIRDYMVCYDFQRLDHNPLEQKLTETTAADPTKTKEECKAAAYHGAFHEFRRCFEKSQNAWRSGLDLLKVSDIESEYPMTWAKRERQLLLDVKSTDAIIQGEYQRKFNLPMGSMTSGLQVVNFGMSFLEEWSLKNGVKWKPKLEL